MEKDVEGEALAAGDDLGRETDAGAQAVDVAPAVIAEGAGARGLRDEEERGAELAAEVLGVEGVKGAVERAGDLGAEGLDQRHGSPRGERAQSP